MSLQADPRDTFYFPEVLNSIGRELRETSEDIRRGATYGIEQVKRGLVEGDRTSDSGLSWIERTWLYASDQEKLFIVLGVVGLAWAIYTQVRK